MTKERKKRNVDLSSKDWAVIEENINNYTDDMEVRKALKYQVERLTSRMDELQISQDDLCKRTGISQGAMSNYTSGNRLIETKFLPKIIKELDISIDYLFGYSEVKDYSYNEISKLLGLNDDSIGNIKISNNNQNINLIFGHDPDIVCYFFERLDEYRKELDKRTNKDSDLQKGFNKLNIKEKKLLVNDAFNDLLEENVKDYK